MSSEIQFEGDNERMSQGTYSNPYSRPNVNIDAGNFSSQNYMHKKTHVPLIFRIWIKLHIAKNERQAQKIVAGIAVILIVIAIYYIKKAVTPPVIVPIRFK